MEKLHLNIFDAMFDKLFEEIHTAASSEGKHCNPSKTQNDNLNQQAVKQESNQSTRIAQTEVILHKDRGGCLETSKKEHFGKWSSHNVPPSRENDLMISFDRGKRFQHKVNTDSKVKHLQKHLQISKSPTVELTEKIQTCKICSEKNKKDVSEQRISESNKGETDAVKTEEVNRSIASDRDLDDDTDALVHTSIKYTENVAYLINQEHIQLSGTACSDGNCVESDSLKERFDSLVEVNKNIQQVCPNNFLDEYKTVYPCILDISSDVMNVSASSADSSAHIEAMLDQLFEESLRQDNQNQTFQQRQQQGSDYHKNMVQTGRQAESQGQIIDLKPSSRRRKSVTEKSACTFSKQLDHQKGKPDRPAHLNVEICEVRNRNMTSVVIEESDCDRQQQCRVILQPQVYSFAEPKCNDKVQTKPTTDLQPSHRQQKMCVHGYKGQECQFCASNLLKEIPASNNVCGIQAVESSREPVEGKTTEEDSIGIRVNLHEETKGCIVINSMPKENGFDSCKKNGKQPYGECKMRNKCDKRDREFSLNNDVKSKESPNICNQQKTKYLDSNNGERRKRLKSGYKDRHLSGSCQAEVVLEQPDVNFGDTTVLKLSGKHALECLTVERSNEKLLEYPCDLKRGTKRKRYDSGQDNSTDKRMSKTKRSKCKRSHLSKKESYTLDCMFSDIKPKRRKTAKDVVVKQKDFAQNGQRIIHKIHKTIAESSDLRTKTLGTEAIDDNELEAVRISELENIIPLDVMIHKNARKAKMRLEKQKGATHRPVSKHGIWRFVNSRY